MHSATAGKVAPKKRISPLSWGYSADRCGADSADSFHIGFREPEVRILNKGGCLGRFGSFQLSSWKKRRGTMTKPGLQPGLCLEEPVEEIIRGRDIPSARQRPSDRLSSGWDSGMTKRTCARS